ncbi:MAG: family acetyltransferase [Agromyces sp.]|nr:family acetyltransferase [Agromyces sp.]
MTSAHVAWPRTAGPLELRTPTSDGIDEVLAWRNRPEVIRWLLRTTVDPEAFRKAWLDSVDDPDQHTALAVVDGRVVGTGSLHVRDGMGQFDGDAWRGAEGDLGYLVDPAYAGRGFATEIARAMLDLAFTELSAGSTASPTASSPRSGADAALRCRRESAQASRRAPWLGRTGKIVGSR